MYYRVMNYLLPYNITLRGSGAMLYYMAKDIVRQKSPIIWQKIPIIPYHMTEDTHLHSQHVYTALFDVNQNCLLKMLILVELFTLGRPTLDACILPLPCNMIRATQCHDV